MFTTLMEFADQQLHALIDFAVYVILFAIVGAAGRGRAPRRDLALGRAAALAASDAVTAPAR